MKSYLCQPGCVIQDDSINAGRALRRVVLHSVIGVPEREEEQPCFVTLVYDLLQPFQHRRGRLCHHALLKAGENLSLGDVATGSTKPCHNRLCALQPKDSNAAAPGNASDIMQQSIHQAPRHARTGCNS